MRDVVRLARCTIGYAASRRKRKPIPTHPWPRSRQPNERDASQHRHRPGCAPITSCNNASVNYNWKIMSRRREPKYEEAAKMYLSGCSVEECANYYGVTRQTMWYCLKTRIKLRPSFSAKPKYKWESLGRQLKSKYDEAVTMYLAGNSANKCAAYFGITPQVMWGILRRRITTRPIPSGRSNHLYRGGLSMRGRAGAIVGKAIRKGILVPQPCEVCGSFQKRKGGRCGVDGHHDDYNKPLEVRWLCKRHHFAWHQKNKPVPLAVSK